VGRGGGVGVGHGTNWHHVIMILSKRQPSPEPLLSLAMRQRSVAVTGIDGRFTTVVSLLSLNTAGSSTNAALGSVSAGGVGTPLFDVTQSGGSPSAFVASHPTGNVGGVTLSKFSLNARGTEHLPGQVSAQSVLL